MIDVQTKVQKDFKLSTAKDISETLRASPSIPVAPLAGTAAYQIVDIRSTPSSGTGDVFCDSNLVQSIVAGLDKPYNCKSIPTLVLYDNRGLQLFDQITYLPEYYLTNAEIDILKNKCHELLPHIPDGSAVIELGAGYVFALL